MPKVAKTNPDMLHKEITNQKNSAIYNHVKQAAELKLDSTGLGLCTSCIAAFNVEKGQHATIQNLLPKVNSKLE
ncbi:unnamed protein product [Orchesella dallaii]|uniref:Uncharacterized protein n=1 Tax=Orchesella dallaii TaxID=48710 RepID=A0ABP1RN47_9HEXA